MIEYNEPALITVLMPVYNAEKYLKEAIESILNQSYTNFEFLIINDGSEDRSEDIILSYRDDRICYFRNEKNSGIVQTLNRGIAFCKGKYIARMDADDISEPTRLKKQLDFMEKNLDYGLIGSQAYLIDEKSCITGELIYPVAFDKILFNLMLHNVFIHPTVFIRTSIFRTFNILFSENYKHAEDYKLWTQFGCVTKMLNLEDKLIKYRIHNEQISEKHQTAQIENSNKIIREYLVSVGLNPEFYKVLSVYTTEADTLQIINLLEELYKVTKTKKRIYTPYLIKYIEKKWRYIFLETSKYPFFMLKKFWTSEISKCIHWTPKQRLNTFIKFFK
jgi:glycosyltransferase involved in cell wall biosynthesis